MKELINYLGVKITNIGEEENEIQGRINEGNRCVGSLRIFKTMWKKNLQNNNKTRNSSKGRSCEEYVVGRKWKVSGEERQTKS